MSSLESLFDLEAIINFYGTTKDPLNCGWLLPNGTMLRYQTGGEIKEHFLVERFYKGKKCDCPNDKDGKPQCSGGGKKYCRYGIRDFFLYYGAVRCIPYCGVVNIASMKSRKDLKNLLESLVFFGKGILNLEIAIMTLKDYDDLAIKIENTVNMTVTKDEYSPGLITKIGGILNA